MGIVPFVTTGPLRSVVFESDDFQRNGRAILIRGADDAQFHRQQACNATYDLRVGNMYRDHRANSGSQTLGSSESIRLLPGNAVIVKTEEAVEFPSALFGQILPRVSLLQKGIANVPSKIDPGYKGHLLITAFNHGKRTEYLKRGDPFCSLHLLSVDEGIVPYSGPEKEIDQRPRSAPFRYAEDIFERYSGVVLVLTLIVALIALFKQ